MSLNRFGDMTKHNSETCPECSDAGNQYHCLVCESYGGWSHHDPSIIAMEDQVHAKNVSESKFYSYKFTDDPVNKNLTHVQRVPKYSGICRNCSTLRDVDGKCGCNE
jgi:hypothetical protein